MKFQHGLQFLAAATASMAVAIPTATRDPRSPPTKLPENIGGLPPGDWECLTNENKGTKTTFSSQYIEDSLKYGLELRDNGDNKAGNSKYPDWITSPESIPGLEDYQGATNVDHFPLNFDDQTIFTGGTPTSGARVFYQHSVQSPDAEFLGLWTHAGRKDGTFVKCEKK